MRILNSYQIPHEAATRREQQVSEQLGEVLKDIYVPENIVRAIVESIASDQGRVKAERQERLLGIRQRLAALRTRMDQMYEDKLDGKIDDEFWSRKMSEWNAGTSAAGYGGFA